MKSFDSFGSFDETDLIAYHLHLLSPQQELAVRTALTLDPNLAAEAKAIAATLHMFDRQEYPAMIGTAVLDNNWQRLRPSLAPHSSRSPFASWLLPLTLAAAVTVLVIVGFWFSSWSSSSPQQGITPQTSSSAPGSPSPSPAPPAAAAPTSHQRETEPAPQPFSRISFPVVDYSLMPPPETATLSMPYVPNVEFLQLPLTTAAIVSSSSSSAAPTPTPKPAPGSTPPPAKRPRKQTDISIGVFGNFTASRNSNIFSGPSSNTTVESHSQSASPSFGVVATFHQQFRPFIGYRIASSYTRNTFTYDYGASNAVGGFFFNTPVSTSIHELTAAYTVEGPRSKRVSTDAEAGAGVLVFVPASPTPSSNYGYNYRRAAVGGVGFNFHVTPRLDVRTEYRALVYETPSFRVGLGGRYTVSSQPTVSLTYHFGGK